MDWQRLALGIAVDYCLDVVELKPNQCWRKSRIAARLLLKREKRPWNDRDRAWAKKLAHDDGVTNRLIDQAINYLTAPISHVR